MFYILHCVLAIPYTSTRHRLSSTVEVDSSVDELTWRFLYLYCHVILGLQSTGSELYVQLPVQTFYIVYRYTSTSTVNTGTTVHNENLRQVDHMNVSLS